MRFSWFSFGLLPARRCARARVRACARAQHLWCVRNEMAALAVLKTRNLHWVFPIRFWGQHAFFGCFVNLAVASAKLRARALARAQHHGCFRREIAASDVWKLFCISGFPILFGDQGAWMSARDRVGFHLVPPVRLGKTTCVVLGFSCGLVASQRCAHVGARTRAFARMQHFFK